MRKREDRRRRGGRPACAPLSDQKLIIDTFTATLRMILEDNNFSLDLHKTERDPWEGFFLHLLFYGDQNFSSASHNTGWILMREGTFIMLTDGIQFRLNET